MIKKLPKSQIEFEIIVSWNDWKKYLDMAVSEASQEIKISGFRPGKAPRNLVEQKVGRAVILNNAAEKAVKKSYAEYLMKLSKSEKLEVIGRPKVELAGIEEGRELKYKATVSVMPEVKVGSGYVKGIKKINKDFEGKSSAADETELELELEKLAAGRIKLVTVRREARTNDGVVINFDVLMSGLPIENGSSRNHPLIIGKGMFIPGFEEQIIGMKEGDKKEFALTFPENYHEKDLAGKPAVFRVEIKLVQERQMPEINDAFAKSLGDFSDLEALKKNIREGLEHENKHKLENEKRVGYIEEIIKNSEAELPDVLVREEISRMILELESRLEPLSMKLDQYLEKIKKSREELEKDWEPQARKRIISALSLKEIAQNQKLEATSKETEEEMNKTLEYYKNVKDAEKNIDMGKLYNYCKNIVENEKVFKYLEKL